MKLPRVLLLYTGGTFGMEYKDDITLAVPRLSPSSLRKRFESYVPEIQRIAHCDVEVILNRDSSHIGPSEWILFANAIQKKWTHYDGIVLLHGTDTMTFTASALSFLLRPCLKPVVITGAQRPLAALRTDARTNLISAVEIAANGPRSIVNQVTVFFHDRLFQGNRIRKRSSVDFAAFESPHHPPLAIVGTSIQYFEPPHSLHRKGPPSKPALKPVLSDKVVIAHLTPSFPSQSILSGLLNHLEALVLVVFHSWTAPTHDPFFLKLLRSAQTKKLPMILVTEGNSYPAHSKRNSVTYEAGKELLSYGCFLGAFMTPECAFVKTALLLGQLDNSKDIRKFSKLWNQDLAGEGVG